ncbi:hypothetical protein ACFY8C_38570 [Streptomyces flavochromogenes]|uniref:Uncharacterized protein n=1 Tax=Streptomyces flavochromogenes TaxID=68199 RepID=A0ABW6Y390_9ACTN
MEMTPEMWIAAGAAGVAVVAAVISAIQAKHANDQVEIAERQLELAEKIHREQNEPYVIVDVQPGAPGSMFLHLIVENIGSTVARNVRISADPPIETSFGEQATVDLQTVLARVYPMIPPGRRLEFLFDGPSRFNGALPMAYTFTVHCEGPFGPVEELEYLVDIATLAESSVGQRPLKRVEQELERIRKELAGLTTAYKKVNAPTIRQEGERQLQSFHERQAQRAAEQPATAQEDDEGAGGSSAAVPG